ncbi:MAG: hypothetical protein ACOYT4_03990 [Nanoarchaeota archaeon]
MAFEITEVLNQWARIGVFSYILPFLLIFAIMYAILDKTGVLGESKGVKLIVSLSVGLLALQFDFYTRFTQKLFPGFAIALVLFLAVLVLWKFGQSEGAGQGQQKSKFLLYFLFAIVVILLIFVFPDWQAWFGNIGIGGTGMMGFIQENFWTLIVGAGVIAAIYAIVFKPKEH